MKKNRLRNMVWIFLAFFLFSSCGAENDYAEKNSDFIYNGLSSDWMTSDRNYIYSRTETPVQMIDLQTKKKYDFVRDPFFEEDEQAPPIIYLFSDEKSVYYLLSDDQSEYQIIRRDSETLSEKVIYEKVIFREQRNLFLGAVEIPSPDMGTYGISDIPNRFAVFENTLFLFQNDSIKAVNLKTKKEFIVLEDGIYNGNYSYYNGNLYFISFAYDIYIYHIQSGELKRLNGYKAQSFLVTPNGIYFAAANDEGRLHFIDFSGHNEKMFPNKAVTSMDFSGRYLYFLSEGDDGIYRMNMDNEEIEKVYDLPGAFDVYCLKNNNTNIVLYTDSDGKFTVHLL